MIVLCLATAVCWLITAFCVWAICASAAGADTWDEQHHGMRRS